MQDVTGDPAALARLRAQRSQLAERMRPPWWYLTGAAVIGALTFGFPIAARYLPPGFPLWPFLAVGLAATLLLQWGLARATGIKMGFRNLRYPASGRPVRIAAAGVSIGAITFEHLLIENGLLATTIVVAVLAVVTQVALLQVQLRGIRQELRTGGGPA
jgi:hypothetical protein